MTSSSDGPALQQFHHDLLYAESMRSALDEQLRYDLESSEFLSENAHEFGELLCKFLDVLALHLRVHYHPQLRMLRDRTVGGGQADTGAARRLELRIYAATQVVAGLTSLLKYVYGSSAKNNPWGTVAQVDRLCRRLFPEARPIIRPGWEYNYTFYPLSLHLTRIAALTEFSDRMLSQGLTNLLNAERYFFSLTYSPTAVDNVLNMAIWAHEIGHAADHILANRQTAGREKTDQSDWAGTYFSSGHLNDFELTPEELGRIFGRRANEQPDEEHTGEEYLEAIAKQDAETIARSIQSWKHELFADLFSIRLFGPAALFAFNRFVHPLSTGFDVSDVLTHPTLPIRVKAMIGAYDSWNSKPEWIEGLPRHVGEAYEGEISYLRSLSEAEPTASFNTHSLPEQVLSHLLEKYCLVDRLAELVDDVVRENPDCYLSPEDMSVMPSAVQDLENALPPDFFQGQPGNGDGVRNNQAKTLALTVNAGWLYWLSRVHQHRRQEPGGNWGHLQDIWLHELNNLNLLLLKSIESAEARHWFEKRRRLGRQQAKRNRPDPSDLPSEAASWFAANGGGVLTGNEIYARIYAGDPPERKLEVRPLLDSNSQVGTCSLDVRLGNEFIITKLPVLTRLDPTELEDNASARQFQSKLHLPLGKPFVLHPGQFVLGSTLEYLALPQEIMGLLVGRSSWKRLGLVVASPTKIIPGFTGCVTLELTNLGNAPVLLYPCARIAQVVFFKMHHQRKVE